MINLHLTQKFWTGESNPEAKVIWNKRILQSAADSFGSEGWNSILFYRIVNVQFQRQLCYHSAYFNKRRKCGKMKICPAKCEQGHDASWTMYNVKSEWWVIIWRRWKYHISFNGMKVSISIWSHVCIQNLSWSYRPHVSESSLINFEELTSVM